MPRLLHFYSPLSFHVRGSPDKGYLLPPAVATTVGIIACNWGECLSRWFSFLSSQLGFGSWRENGIGLRVKPF